MQPLGYVHSLGFIDQARFVRYQFRRLGAQVSLAKNRLREDAINIIFGAHLGFPAEWKCRHTCLFVNLEQLGWGGAAVSGDYLRLLQTSAVLDYDAANVGSYCADNADVPLLPFGYAPYLDHGDAPDLEDRPIDLLFFGSMNPRRRAFIDRIEACGVQVAAFDQPLYGPERDQFIRQAKAVLNCHFYATSRFEQVRVSHCLSLGTPVISERHEDSRPAPMFEDAVLWVADHEVESFFRERFGKPGHVESAQACLAAFRRHDPLDAYADALAFAVGYHCGSLRTRNAGAWRPERMHLAAGSRYRPGWLNVDSSDKSEADLVLDLGGGSLILPLSGSTRHGSRFILEASSVEHIYASDAPARTPDLPTLMSNLLALLKVDGVVEIDVPFAATPNTWPDPTQRRVLDENSWACCTDRFWEANCFSHRFEAGALQWLDDGGQPSSREAAAHMRIVLRKVEATLRERTLARTMRADFGDIGDDLPTEDPDNVLPVAAPVLDIEPAAPASAPSKVNPRFRKLEVAVQIDKLIDLGRFADALQVMVGSINSDFCLPGVAHTALYYPQFDRQIETLAVLLDRSLPAQAEQAPDETNVIIATELYQVGGHTKVIEDVANELVNPVIILTDLFGTNHRAPSSIDWFRERLPGATVLVLPARDMWGKCRTLGSIVRGLRPKNILHFNHHQDPLPFVATLSHRGARQALVHHCDHNPSVGCTLKALEHVDVSPRLQEICAAHLGQPAYLLPLHVPDRGVQTVEAVQDNRFSVVTSGRVGKFARAGDLQLKDIVLVALRALSGSFFHVGPLADDWLQEIRGHLSAHGIDASRFVSLGLVPSLWKTLRETKAAFYVGSAPVGGGRAAIEAQGCGLPVLFFTGFEHGSLVENYSLYADQSLGWSDITELGTLLRTLGARHTKLSGLARKFYEEGYSRERFRATLEALLGLEAVKRSIRPEF